MLGLPGFDWQGYLQKVADKQAGLIRLGKKLARIHRISGTSPSHPLHDYAGSYENKGYGVLQVETGHDSLYAKVPVARFWLRHYHYDSFETMDMVPGEAIDSTQTGLPHLQFNTGDDGHIASLSIQFEASLPPTLFARLPGK